jgi:hypothetical protein
MLETQYKDITFFSDLNLWTLETDIYYILNGHWNVVEFDYENDITIIKDNLKLYDLKLWQYLLESDNKEYLSGFESSILEQWTDIKWNFEYKGMHYIILYRPKINWDIKINTDNTRDRVDEVIN